MPYDPIKHGTPLDFGGATIHVPGKGDLPITMSNKIKHISGKYATKFNTPEESVKAYEFIKSSPANKAFKVDPLDSEPIKGNKMSEIFGPTFESRIKGYDTNGNLTTFGPNTKIDAIFEKDMNGIPQLKTMYPDP